MITLVSSCFSFNSCTLGVFFCSFYNHFYHGTETSTLPTGYNQIKHFLIATRTPINHQYTQYEICPVVQNLSNWILRFGRLSILHTCEICDKVQKIRWISPNPFTHKSVYYSFIRFCNTTQMVTDQMWIQIRKYGTFERRLLPQTTYYRL